MDTPLSREEESTLKKCEAVIRKGIKSGLAMGKALKTIRDQRLYRKKFETFEEYLDKVRSLSRSYANALIGFAEVRDTLSAMAGKHMELPANERQARPLVKLAPEKRLAAWKTVISKAGNGPVTESNVRRVVNDALGLPKAKSSKTPISQAGEAKPLAWAALRVNALASDKYAMNFEQPLPWKDDEVADIHCEEEDVYLKFIDKVEVSNVLYAIALKAEFAKSFIIINGEANRCAEVEPSEDGELEGLFCPHLNFFAKQAGVHVEYGGKLYEAGDLVNNTEIVWKPANDKVLLGIFEKYMGEADQNQNGQVA